MYTEKDIRVRDHCPITGKCRGSTHQTCNVNYRLTQKMPITFHNLRGSNSHYIIQEIDKFEEKINVISNGYGFHVGKI